MLFLAIALSALRSGTAAWDRALFAAALLAVLTAVLLAIHRADRARAFWIGFALFGGVYLALCQVDGVRSRLATTRALIALDQLRPTVTIDLSDPKNAAEKAKINRPDGTANPDVILGISGGRLYATIGGTPEHYYPIGHSLWTILVGVAGGRLSRYLHVVGRRETAAPAA